MIMPFKRGLSNSYEFPPLEAWRACAFAYPQEPVQKWQRSWQLGAGFVDDIERGFRGAPKAAESPLVTTSRIRFSPACAPRQSSTS
jgi:hypothetical protein